MSVGAGGDALVRYRLLQRRHLFRERWSVCVRPVQMVNNGWTRIHMADSCMLGERGRRRGGAVLSPSHSHLSIELAYSSSYQLLPLHSFLQHQTLSAGFFSFLIISVVYHLRLHHSTASPSSLLHLSLSLSASCFSLSTASSLMFPPRFIFSPSWQRTVREAGTSTCTRRLSGDAAAAAVVLSSSN